MQEPSDGIAEELERQLQLALAGAAIAARRAVSARQQALEQAARDSHHAVRAAKNRIDADRALAAISLEPVFNDAWWKNATPHDVASMSERADSWRTTESENVGDREPTIFDRAAGRIRHELRARAGLDPPKVVTLATVQDHEREHQATLAHPPARAADMPATEPNHTVAPGFDAPERRELLRTRLAAAGIPEAAIEARTLADVAQAREAAEAAVAPVAAAVAPWRAGAPNEGLDQQRHRRH